MKPCLIILLMLLTVFLTPAAGWTRTDPESLMIVYSGDIRSTIEPGGCCFRLGGIARVATVIHNLKTEHPRVLVLDAGDYLWHQSKPAYRDLEAQTLYHAMKAIPYDAMNMADGEILAGRFFLDTFGSDPDLPLTSLNVRLSGDRQARPAPYIIRQMGDVRVAVIGLTSPHLVPGNIPDGFILDDPVDMMKRHIREIRDQADLVILLSHLGWEKLQQLLQAVDGIDLVISGHDTYPTFEPEQMKNTWIVKTAISGGVIGTVRLDLDPETGKPQWAGSDMILLEEKITPLPVYAEMETAFNRELREIQAEEARSQNRKMDDFMKMSPEEFMKYMKEQNEKQSRPL